MQFGRTYEEFEVGAVYKHWPGKTGTEYGPAIGPTLRPDPRRSGRSAPA